MKNDVEHRKLSFDSFVVPLIIVVGGMVIMTMVILTDAMEILVGAIVLWGFVICMAVEISIMGYNAIIVRTNKKFTFPASWLIEYYDHSPIGIDKQGDWSRVKLRIFSPDWEKSKSVCYNFNWRTEEIHIPTDSSNEINLSEYLM